MCLNLPYNYYPTTLSTPVVNIKFTSFNQVNGAVLQSGTNANTWEPFNSPDNNDPIPAENRGLHFDGIYRFLMSPSSFTLNYKNSVAM
jgi:hypothetical protein